MRERAFVSQAASHGKDVEEVMRESRGDEDGWSDGWTAAGNQAESHKKALSSSIDRSSFLPAPYFSSFSCPSRSSIACPAPSSSSSLPVSCDRVIADHQQMTVIHMSLCLQSLFRSLVSCRRLFAASQSVSSFDHVMISGPFFYSFSRPWTPPPGHLFYRFLSYTVKDFPFVDSLEKQRQDRKGEDAVH